MAGPFCSRSRSGRGSVSMEPQSPPREGIPEGCLYCRTVVDLGLYDRPSMGMISDRGSATALPDLLPSAGLLPFAGPLDRREQRRDPRASP
ncbi:hypothetical protein ACFYOY_44390 [Streptomyces sp. NPDC007875]|uniref:hypothetical protein n=1 Tax=Streptomyces sp. NPDC007875 TaxID=3364783 RepID=UPI0036C7AFC6